ncbi:hypothetical protein Hanom_Chr13g01196511 [Helianthus anomalus]
MFIYRRSVHDIKSKVAEFVYKNKHPGIKIILSKLQVLSFIYVTNYRRCPLSLNLTSFVLNVSKSCTLCPLSLTQLTF